MQVISYCVSKHVTSGPVTIHFLSAGGSPVTPHAPPSALTTAFVCSRAWSVITGENCRLDWCTIKFQFRTSDEPSKVVSVKSYCLCRGQEYTVHNLHCFWQIRMVSARSVTDSTDWSLPSRIIGSTRGLPTPCTRTETGDSEVCDSHTTIRPQELPQYFQSRRSSQDRLYKELHPVTLYICWVLVHCSSKCFLRLCQALYDPEQRTPRA